MNADEVAEIQRLHAAGHPITRIAATMRMSRNTVRRVIASLAPGDAGVDGASGAARVPEGARIEAHDAGRVPGGRPASVPSFATEFIGRRSEINDLRALLGAHRLVTIAGFGGVGKTRLAARVAVDVRRAFADGVRMIELASVRNAELLPQVVLDGLGLSHLAQPARSITDSLVEHLRGRQLLIVLDNCEHVRQACAELVDLVLRGTSQVTFLTTSREVLDLPGEHVEVLEPLPTGDSARHGEPTTAMTLFESRARDVLSGFRIDDGNYDAVRRIVERLDGLPLAIELACFRLRVLSVGELADRLDEGFALLSTRARSGQERHQSLQAAMAWSYELCTPEQRLLWARSSVFAGGFDAGMVEAVCSDEALPPDVVLDCIYDLVGKSILLREEVGGRVRFRVLESIREFGQAMLSDSERGRLQSRHLAWCSRMVSDSVDEWFGSAQTEVAERLRVNLPNVRTALQTALARQADPASAVAADLVALPWWLWACGLSAREHTMWLEQVLTLDCLDDGRRMQALTTLAMVQTLQGDRAAADGNVERALALATPLGNETVVAFATNVRGLSAFFGGDSVLGEALLRESITRYERIPDRRPDLWCTPRVHLGMLLSLDRRTEEAARCFESVRDLSRSAGERWMLSYAVFGLGLVALTEERYADAIDLARLSLELKRDFQDGVGTSLAVELLGWAEAGAGSAPRAALLLAAASELWGAFGQHLYGSEQWQQRRVLFEERARDELGDRRFAECQVEATAMGLDDLMELARGAEPAARGTAQPADATLVRLSVREREVALRIADGLSNKQIAEVLVLSPRTVEGHVEHILQKLGLRNRQEIAVTVAAGTR